MTGPQSRARARGFFFACRWLAGSSSTQPGCFSRFLLFAELYKAAYASTVDASKVYCCCKERRRAVEPGGPPSLSSVKKPRMGLWHCQQMHCLFCDDVLSDWEKWSVIHLLVVPYSQVTMRIQIPMWVAQLNSFVLAREFCSHHWMCKNQRMCQMQSVACAWCVAVCLCAINTYFWLHLIFN